MKVVVTGSSGMLGSKIVRALAKSNNFQVYGVDMQSSPSINHLQEQKLVDLIDLRSLKQAIEEIKPEIIIHLAAIVNLKVCEDDFNVARALHVDATRFLARQNTKMLYISTDSVFNGEEGNYTEKSIPDPLNNYGMTKYLGELAVRANNKNSLVIRTNIFGYNNPLKASLAEWALRELKNGNQINGYSNVMFNAIYTKHLANIIVNLVGKSQNGIVNIASKTQISKYDFLLKLANEMGQSSDIVSKVKLINNDDTSMMRPLNTTLNIDRAAKFIELPTIESGIAELAKDYKEEDF